MVWINGSFVERDCAQVSAFDAGLVHGVGLFETMLACGDEGRVFRIERHMDRLARSAAELGLSESLRTRPLAEAVENAVRESGLTGRDLSQRARVRLTVTGGDLNLLAQAGGNPSDPTVMVHVQPATIYPEKMFEMGVGVLVADARANPLNPFEGHKTVNYWWRLRALQGASARGMGEALVLGVTNHVVGGAVSNVFAVHDGSMLTPIAHGEEEQGAMHSPVLPGITREAVIECGESMGVGCKRAMVSIAEILDADEVFLTNSSWGVLPVVQVEGKTIGSGAPGELTRDLRTRWLKLVQDEP